MTTRIILENLATIKLGYALPLYDSAANHIRQIAVGNLTNAELVEVIVDAPSKLDTQANTQQPHINNQVFPLRLRKKDDITAWELPVECLFSLKSRNIMTRRTVAKNKGRGSVKENWSQDDYEISIQGIFFDRKGAYPAADLKRLRAYCECGEAITVECPLFEIYAITHIVIEDCDLPFTKGENIQGFSLKCYSDDIAQLLIEENISIL